MSVDLWAARLERPLMNEEMERLLLLLPEKRRERLMRTRESKRQEALCAYALLRMALKERCGWQDWPEITVGEQGKPGFSEYPKVQFSISHTEGAVLVGLADRPVGVDLEKIRPISERTMRKVAGVALERSFFQTWVRREARAKRDGVSVAGMLRREPELTPGEHYREIELFPGYAAGLSICGEAPEIRVRRCSLEELLADFGNVSNRIPDKEKERC